MNGMFSTFRNPAAHAPKVAWATSRSDALDMLTLASMLHRCLAGVPDDREQSDAVVMSAGQYPGYGAH
jgi:hypothetical protein